VGVRNFGLHKTTGHPLHCQRELPFDLASKSHIGGDMPDTLIPSFKHRFLITLSQSVAVENEHLFSAARSIKD